jgi:DNA repair protein RadD
MYMPRPYQIEARQSVFDYFTSGKTGNPVVAMPGGTGKSIVIADIITEIFKIWPTQRVMMLTHVKELITQNAEKLMSIWPTAPLGIYSAGLNSRDMILPIVFGGIQSVAKAIEKSINNPLETRPAHYCHFGFRDLLFVDECHLISPNDLTIYQYVITELKRINPKLKVIGFTATPYRLKQGLITNSVFEKDENGNLIDKRLFTDICYDITGIEPFNKLIAEGYLSPLIPKRTNLHFDLQNVRLGSNGDYSEKSLQNAVDQDEITFAAVKEMIELAYNRSTCLVFASGIDHAEHICEMLRNFGETAGVVHSKLSDEHNDKTIKAFKENRIKWLVNKDKLTTGFDHPPIDFIGMLRATLSPGLWVQMLCRGTRPWENKSNCMVADFARNSEVLGPINDPNIPKQRNKGTGDAPIKICVSCGIYNHASARSCIACGEAFTFETKIFETASISELLRGEAPTIETFRVDKVIYSVHNKDNSPPMLKVSYYCGFNLFTEYKGLEHSGRFGKDARDWWRQRHTIEPPLTVYEAMRYTGQLRTPNEIRVHTNLKYPEILQYNSERLS